MRACALLLVVSAAAGWPAPAPVLRAGAHAEDVTPAALPVLANCMFLSRTFHQVEGKLYARALALDDGATPIAIVVVDSCMLPRELLDEAKERASRSTGIPASHMLISATHTHSAPSAMGCLGTNPDPGYPQFLVPRIAAAIDKAVRNLAPARVGWTVVDAPEYTHCRRWIARPDRMLEDPFGVQTVRANMHPGHQNPDFLGPSGPVDSGLSVLAVQSPVGLPMALLANFSMHYVGAKDGLISADYFGIFADRMAALLGQRNTQPPFVAIMSQGTSGDQQWRDYAAPRQDSDMPAYSEAIASLAHTAYRSIRYHDWVPVRMAEKTIRLRRRTPDAERLAWAKGIISKMGSRLPANRPEVYAREQVYLAETPERKLKLQAIRIGELGITAIPNEVFGITGLKLKAQSPLETTFNIELANGAEGYIPPPEQHKLGGYTTWPARTAALEVTAEPRIVAGLLAVLEQVAGRPRRPFSEPPTLHAKRVLAANPAVYWRMGEWEGPRAFDATNRFHGSYEDGVAFYLEGPGVLNRAPQFAGGRMAADVPGLGNRYTIEFWFYNALPTDAREVAGYLFSVGGDTLGIAGTSGNTGKLVLGDFSGTTVITPKTWRHLALVRDGPQVTVYLDGNLEISGSLPVHEIASAVFIGGGADRAFTFEGRIDEVALYNRPLTREELIRR